MRLSKKAQRIERAFRFFQEQAGYIVGQRALNALSLAKAEYWASVKGIEFVTMSDGDADASFVGTWSEREQENGASMTTNASASWLSFHVLITAPIASMRVALPLSVEFSMRITTICVSSVPS
jgi:hypothetical protein